MDNIDFLILIPTGSFRAILFLGLWIEIFNKFKYFDNFEFYFVFIMIFQFNGILHTTVLQI